MLACELDGLCARSELSLPLPPDKHTYGFTFHRYAREPAHGHIKTLKSLPLASWQCPRVVKGRLECPAYLRFGFLCGDYTDGTSVVLLALPEDTLAPSRAH